MRHPFRTVLPLLLLSVLMSGCGPDRSQPSTAAGTAPAGLSTQTPSKPITPPGFRTFEAEVGGFVAKNYVAGFRYIGMCETAKVNSKGICAIKKGPVGDRVVFALGSPYGEIDGYLLMETQAGLWKIRDWYSLPSLGETADPATIPSWVTAIDG